MLLLPVSKKRRHRRLQSRRSSLPRLFRQRAGQLGVDIPLVLSNHPDLGELAAFYGVPFESHPVASPGQKLAFEKARDKVWELEGYRLKSELYALQEVAE